MNYHTLKQRVSMQSQIWMDEEIFIICMPNFTQLLQTEMKRERDQRAENIRKPVPARRKEILTQGKG